MKITEDVLKELGFERQNPCHIWDYTEPHLRGSPRPSLHWRYRLCFSMGEWTLHIREAKDSGVQVRTVMDIAVSVGTLCRAVGVAETQTALHAALGLDKLKQDILDRLPSERRN